MQSLRQLLTSVCSSHRRACPRPTEILFTEEAQAGAGLRAVVNHTLINWGKDWDKLLTLLSVALSKYKNLTYPTLENKLKLELHRGGEKKNKQTPKLWLKGICCFIFKKLIRIKNFTKFKNLTKY